MLLPLLLNNLLSEGGAPTPSPSPVDMAGGWAAFFAYEEDRDKRRKRYQEIDEAEEATQELAPVDAEIAKFLHQQERKDEQRAELDRLRALVNQFPRSDMPPRVQAAIDKASTKQTVSALINLKKELQRMAEEEEMAVLMFLIDSD